MKGLCSYTGERQYHQPSQPQEATICSRLRRVFKGPPKPAATPQYRDEKKYRHVPTHSASSFLKTATTPAMVAAHVQKHGEPQLGEIRVMPDTVERGHTPPPQSLI